MRREIPLIAGLALSISALAQQPADTPAPTSQAARAQPASPTSAPRPRSGSLPILKDVPIVNQPHAPLTLDFPGGTLREYVSLVQSSAMGLTINIIADEATLERRVRPISLKRVSADVAPASPPSHAVAQVRPPVCAAATPQPPARTPLIAIARDKPGIVARLSAAAPARRTIEIVDDDGLAQALADAGMPGLVRANGRLILCSELRPSADPRPPSRRPPSSSAPAAPDASHAEFAHSSRGMLSSCWPSRS